MSGVSWKRIDTGLPSHAPSSIAFGPDGSTIYVTYSMPGQNVYRSSDGGATWASIVQQGGDLSNIRPDGVVVNRANGHLYVFGSAKVYTSLDGGITWRRLAGNLPTVMVNEMVFDARTSQLYAGTFGRGVWSVRAP